MERRSPFTDIFFLSKVVRAWNDFVLERKPLAGIDGRLRSDEDEEKEKDKDLLAKSSSGGSLFFSENRNDLQVNKERRSWCFLNSSNEHLRLKQCQHCHLL
jgi:hypothetical protein